MNYFKDFFIFIQVSVTTEEDSESETDSDWETESDEDLSFADVIQPFVKQVSPQSKTSSKDQQNLVKELVLHESYVPNIESPLVNEEEQEIIETMSFQDVRETTYGKKDRQQSADSTIRPRKTLVESLHYDFLETTDDGNSSSNESEGEKTPTPMHEPQFDIDFVKSKDPKSSQIDEFSDSGSEDLESTLEFTEFQLDIKTPQKNVGSVTVHTKERTTTITDTEFDVQSKVMEVGSVTVQEDASHSVKTEDVITVSSKSQTKSVTVFEKDSTTEKSEKEVSISSQELQVRKVQLTETNVALPEHEVVFTHTYFEDSLQNKNRGGTSDSLSEFVFVDFDDNVKDDSMKGKQGNEADVQTYQEGITVALDQSKVATYINEGNELNKNVTTSKTVGSEEKNEIQCAENNEREVPETEGRLLHENIPRTINAEKSEYVNDKRSSIEDEPTIECVAFQQLQTTPDIQLNLLEEGDLLKETGKEYPSIEDSESDSSDSFVEVFDNAIDMPTEPAVATASETINNYDAENVKGMLDPGEYQIAISEKSDSESVVPVDKKEALLPDKEPVAMVEGIVQPLERRDTVPKQMSIGDFVVVDFVEKETEEIKEKQQKKELALDKIRDDLETENAKARVTLRQDGISVVDLIQKETRVNEIAEETLMENLIQDEDFSKDFEVDLQVEGTDIHEEGTVIHEEGTDIHEEGTDIHGEDTDIHEEGADLQVEGTDLQVEGSDIHEVGTDIHEEGTDLHEEGTDLQVEGTDLQVEDTDIHEEGTDIHEEGTDLHEEGTDIHEENKNRKRSSEDLKQEFLEQLAELKKLTANAGNLDDEKQSLNPIPVLPVLPRETEDKTPSPYRRISVDINLESSDESDAEKFEDENEPLKSEQRKRKHSDEKIDKTDIKKKVVENRSVDLNQLQVIPDPTIVKPVEFQPTDSAIDEISQSNNDTMEEENDISIPNANTTDSVKSPVSPDYDSDNQRKSAGSPFSVTSIVSSEFNESDSESSDTDVETKIDNYLKLVREESERLRRPTEEESGSSGTELSE